MDGVRFSIIRSKQTTQSDHQPSIHKQITHVRINARHEQPKDYGLAQKMSQAKDKRLKRVWQSAISVLLVLGIISACQGEEIYSLPERDPIPKVNPSPTVPTATASPTPVPTATATPFPIVPIRSTSMPLYDFAEGVNPLTGLAVDDPSILERRPVMVKVSNWPRDGRPHAGLSAADIVFEYFIGYQMNRFMAIYYGQDSANIGPVRSGQLVDAKLVRLYQGLLAYGNADPAVDKVIVNVLGERVLAFGFIPCPAMCGETTHSATGVFANSAEITKYAIETGINNDKPDLRGMYFQNDLDNWDDLGNELSFMYADFSVIQWRYNGDVGKYELWQDFETEDDRIILAPMVDRDTDQPLSFSNILILFATYTQFSPSLNDIDLFVGERPQSAILFRDGKLIYGSWQAPYQDYPLIFNTQDGDLLPLKPGNTWVVIAGNHTLTERISIGEWDFSFELP